MGEFRRSAWLIAAAAIVPLLLFVLLQSGFAARQERSDIEFRALSTSSALIVAADGEVRRHFAGLAALGTARSLRHGDLEEFKSRGEEFIRLNDGWRAATLIDLKTGNTLVNVGSHPEDVEITVKVPPANEPRFMGIARGRGCPCLLFDRLAVAPPGKSWAVRLLVNSDELQSRLPPGGGTYEVSAIVDREGRFLTRSLNYLQLFGRYGAPALRKAVGSRSAEGIYQGQTLEGVENYTGFARSKLTGWSAHVALPSGFVENPGRRFIASIGAAAVLSLLLAGVLIAFSLRQISQSRRINERMQQAQKLEALGQLTGGIAHDFNNLLTPIVGALDFVTKKPATDMSSKRLLVGALASALRASKLTSQLLAFSRRQNLTIEPVKIAEMLNSLSDLLRQSIGDRHTLEITQNDKSLCALADHNQLELAILNLLMNARDASPDGSRIALRITGSGNDDAGQVDLIVSDTGSGMDEATRQRAMEPFFTTKPLGRGTGLGLAQVFGLAAQSGGHLQIDSAVGIGTTMTLSLRRCPRPTDLHENTRPPAEPAKSGLRLLVVDDDPLVRAAIVAPLEEAGHMVDAVSDGVTALAALSQRSFDLVLVDFAMPEMNGTQLIQSARKIRPSQRFVIVTGYADSDAIKGAAQEAVLRKPFLPSELLEVVHEHTTQSRN